MFHGPWRVPHLSRRGERVPEEAATVRDLQGNTCVCRGSATPAPPLSTISLILVAGKQASEALAILLCHPSGADGGEPYSNVSPGGRLQAGMGYLGGGGGGGGAAATAAARENEVHWKRLMFFFDM